MKNINLELYKVFYEVGKQKNITKAANSLYISQPAITQQIQKLESELNYKLFYRTRYGVEFTAEGERVFSDIESSMKLLENVPDNLDKYNNVIHNLNFASSYGSSRMIIIPKVPDIIKKYPDINVKVEKYDNEGLIDALLNNSADIVVINDNTLNTENVCYYKSITIERVFVASKDFVRKNKINKITKKDFLELPFIATGKTSSTRIILEDYLAEKCITLNPKFDIDSFEMSLELILKGMGIAVFNKPYIQSYLDGGELVEIDSCIKFPTRTLYVAINKKNMNNPFIMNVVNILLNKW